MAEEGRTLWGSMISLWNLRNEERHGWDQESKDRSRREVLHAELADIYTQKLEYPRRVQALLRGSFDLHIQDTATQIADWLDCYQGTFAVTWQLD